MRATARPLAHQNLEHTSTRARAENGVSGGGLMTAVQPAARAAASLRVIIADGKFQGVKIDLPMTSDSTREEETGEHVHHTYPYC